MDAREFLSVAAGMVVGLHVAGLAHELGHATAAWALGGRVTLVSVGTARRSLRFNAGATTFNLAPGWGGRTYHATPLSGWGRPQKAAVVSAGIAANLALGAVLAGTWGAVHGSTLVFVIGLANLIVGLSNLAPTRAGDGVESDGIQLFRILANRPASASRAHTATFRRLEHTRRAGDPGTLALCESGGALVWAALGEREQAAGWLARPLPQTGTPGRLQCLLFRRQARLIVGLPDEVEEAAFQAFVEVGLDLRFLDRVFRILVDPVDRPAEGEPAIAADPRLREVDRGELATRLALGSGDPGAAVAAWNAWRRAEADTVDRFVLGERLLALAIAEADRADIAREVAKAGAELLTALEVGEARARVEERVRRVKAIARA